MDVACPVWFRSTRPLWARRQRGAQGGEEDNENGNPYIDAKEILSIWRESVPAEDRRDWLIIDPAERDRVLDVSEVETLVPLQTLPPAESAPAAESESPVAASPASCTSLSGPRT